MPKQVTINAGEIVDLLIALDLARDCPFMEIRRAIDGRPPPREEKAAIISQVMRFNALTLKLEAVLK